MIQDQNNNTIPQTSSLAMNALDDIPQPNANAQEIVALVKHSGKVTGYQLSNGTTLSKEDGVALAKTGGIKGVGISHRNGQEYLKSLPDQTDNNNLSRLPTVSDSSFQG
ncbi:DUF3892 domain-containing protein [Anaerosporobacter faecicola]|uniref:DUF3892 domain-containing protein n=1 Tax=Anaerosporobacter faecicola TaxID=2718714 RepID=UPI00143BBCC7|nr:DUF3892 domain-containing protein [Anaerosporobacter faecicola]